MFKASLWFSLGTLLSRLLGLLRESVIAGIFGASTALDAFLVANRIPNMLREMLAEGALGSAFTKVFSEVWEKDRQEARRLLADCLQLFTLLALVVTALGILLAPWLVELMTMLPQSAGSQDSFLEQTVGLTRFLFPFIAFMMLGAIASGALHQKGRFFLSSAAPLALNCGYLLGALLLAPLLTHYAPDWVEVYIADKAITGLAAGVLVGGFMQLCLQLAGLWRPFIAGHSHLFTRRWPWSQDVKRVLILMGPMVLASSAGQINVLVNTNFATSLGTGAVTWLTFSFRLLQLPIGLFAVAIGSVALPTFTRLLAKTGGQVDQASGEKLFALSEFMLWLMLACFCFVAFNSQAIIALLYEHGRFTHADTLATADALYYYSFGLLGYGLIKVLTAFYYALERTRFAMLVSLLGVGVNALLNYLFVKHFGASGLAITASALLSFNAMGLIVGLRQEKIPLPQKALRKGSLLLLAAFALAYGGQTFAENFWGGYLNAQAFGLKTQAAISLLASGFWLGLVFAGFGFVRLGQNPKQAWRNFRRQRG